MKLVIAEKPSAAQSYAKALNITAKKSGYFEGNGYSRQGYTRPDQTASVP